MRRRASGFTLFELILVLVILSILGVLVLPSFTGSRDRSRVESQARAAIALARKAHALASAEGRTYLLVIDREAGELRLARHREPLAEVTDEDDPELDAPEDAPWATRFPFLEAVEVESFELGGELVEEGGEVKSRLAFRANGEADDGRVIFAKADERIAVRVDPYLGIARIEAADEDAE